LASAGVDARLSQNTVSPKFPYS